MSYFKMGKADAYKIFTSWDFLTYKSFELKEKTTCKELNEKLTSFHQGFSSSDSAKHLSLFVIVREIKQKSLLFKRKLNFFELPLEVYRETVADLAEDAKNREVLLLSVGVKEFYCENSEDFAQMYANFASLFKDKPGKKDSGYERAGELLKYSKNGQFKRKKFELSKTQLIYYNPKEKEKNVNFIPLEGSFAEPFAGSKEKYVFLIRTYDKSTGKEKNFILKAKSSMDMNGWVLSVNSQAFMCTENRRNQEIGGEILKNQKRFAELAQEKELKILTNLQDFLTKSHNFRLFEGFLKENPQLSDDFLEFLLKAAEISLKFTESPDERASFFEFLEKVHEKWLTNQDFPEFSLENPTKTLNLPGNLASLLDLPKIFAEKPGKPEEIEVFAQLQPKLFENLRKHASFSRIFASFLAKCSKNSQLFAKPFVFDLKNRKISENTNNFLGVPQKLMGKNASASDLFANPHKKSSNWPSLSNSYYKFSEEMKT